MAVILAFSFLSGLLSPMIIAQRQSFMAAAIAHYTFLGLAIAFALLPLEHSVAIYFVTLLITLILSFLLARAGLENTVPFESLIGLFFSVSMGFGVLILHLVHADGHDGHDEHIDLHHYLFGDILLLDKPDVIIAFFNIVLVCGFMALYFKKWIYFIVDREGAFVAGQKTKYFHYSTIILLSITIVSFLKIGGVILVNSMLLIPGIFSLKMATNMRDVFLYSVFFAVLSAALGAFIINMGNLPSGATIGSTQFVLYFLALAIKRLWCKNN